MFKISNWEETQTFSEEQKRKTDFWKKKNIINYTKKNKQDRVRSEQRMNNINIEKLQGSVEIERGGMVMLKHRMAYRRQ